MMSGNNVAQSQVNPSDRIVVTLCGSMRFFDQMLKVARDYTMRGFIVVMPHVDVKEMTEESAEDLKLFLDRLHMEKIELAEMICVVMVDNYVGESTQKEIAYAARCGRSIEWSNFPTNKSNIPKSNTGKVFASGMEVDPITLKPVHRVIQHPPVENKSVIPITTQAIKDIPQA
jgi:hypothetical protein